jgi:hypothetical protein
MAATSTAICNLALNRCGQPTIDDISGSDVLEEKCNLLYTQALEELLTEGPQLGWKFARRRYHGTDDHSVTITAFADGGSGEVDVTATAHGLVVGDMVYISGTTSYNGYFDVVTVADANTFSIVDTYVADDATGTAQWYSEQYQYRYSIPTASLRVIQVQVGGLELTDWVREDDYILTNQESSEIDMIYVNNETTTTRFPPYFTSALVLNLAIKLHYNLTQDLNAIQVFWADYDRALHKAIAMDEREKYVKEYSNSWQEAGHTTDFLE